MIWKIAGATVAFYILWVGFFAFTAAGNAVGNQIASSSYGSLGLNGLTVSVLFSNMMGEMAAGFAIALIFLVLYLYAAASSKEEDSGFLEG